ncbi:MAG: hypothetical protein GYA36_21260 [Veillonellaceae bacterium]|nr:hypothetical protein [Veillonellaceae bacterium]
MVEEFVSTSDVKTLAEATAATLIAAGVIQPPKKRRMRTNWEAQLAWEYVQKFYQDKPHWLRIEVGAIPKGEEGPLYARVRRWCDAVIIEDDHVLMLETKMRPKPDVVGQIQNYARLFPETPLFRRFKDMPLKLRVVAAMVDDDIKAFIEANGIEVEIYKPSNFDKWYDLVITQGYGYKNGKTEEEAGT